MQLFVICLAIAMTCAAPQGGFQDSRGPRNFNPSFGPGPSSSFDSQGGPPPQSFGPGPSSSFGPQGGPPPQSFGPGPSSSFGPQGGPPPQSFGPGPSSSFGGPGRHSSAGPSLANRNRNWGPKAYGQGLNNRFAMPINPLVMERYIAIANRHEGVLVRVDADGDIELTDRFGQEVDGIYDQFGRDLSDIYGL